MCGTQVMKECIVDGDGMDGMGGGRKKSCV